jgi:NAD(P)-dependent dehydrogenase (short-subunit alcohol dehydrogenase family)
MKLSKYNLINKTALITGASGLLGIEHAHALLESGATVVLTDLYNENLLEVKNSLENKDNKGRIYCHVMDVSIEESIKDVSVILKNNGLRIDILVNNAAINPTTPSLKNNVRTTRVENFSLDTWNKEISVGLTGSFLCSKIFGMVMAADGKGGVILNIASDLSVIAPDQRLYSQEELADHLQAVKPVTYSVIKTGLIGLTRYLSTYWVDKGVRCNALSPGGVFNGEDDDFVQKITHLIPMNRMATKDEYRGAVQFLCSDASAYINGQNIVMDGGRSVL